MHRDSGISKIKGIDVSSKGINDDNKTARPNQLDAVFKKKRFDKSGPTQDERQPTHKGNPHA